MRINSPLEQYRRALADSLPAHRRKRMAWFEDSLTPFLEEVPEPTYKELIKAFGPPEDMAWSLLEPGETLTDPMVRRRRRKGVVIGSVVGMVALLLSIGMGWQYNAPESGGLLSKPISVKGIGDSRFFAVEDPFTRADSRWEQPWGTCYCVEAENTGKVPTNVIIQFSELCPDHFFQVPPGETRAFYVQDAIPGEHIISFNASDGTLSGHVRVLVADESWRP